MWDWFSRTAPKLQSTLLVMHQAKATLWAFNAQIPLNVTTEPPVYLWGHMLPQNLGYGFIWVFPGAYLPKGLSCALSNHLSLFCFFLATAVKHITHVVCCLVNPKGINNGRVFFLQSGSSKSSVIGAIYTPSPFSWWFLPCVFQQS